MSIDNNIIPIPSIIYLLYDVGSINYNINMSDEIDVMVDDNHDEEDLPYYDANNANTNDDTIDNLDNNDNVKPSGDAVDHDVSETHDYVIVNDNKDLEISINDDDGEVVVVTDVSIATAPSSYMKKNKKKSCS